MQFPTFKQRQISSATKQEKPSFQQNFIDIRSHFSGFLQHIKDSIYKQQQTQPNFPLFNSDPSALKIHLDLALENLGNQAKQAFHNGISGFGSTSSSSRRNPFWARVSVQNETLSEPIHRFDLAMSTEAIEERLAGVPVYALSNSAEEFVLVSGARTGNSLGLFCFKKEDADTLLEQMKSMDPGMRRGSKVVAVALNKVFQLKVEGVAFRLIPDPSQIKNALMERQKAGFSEDGFSGVPVFQTNPGWAKFRKQGLPQWPQLCQIFSDSYATGAGGITSAQDHQVIDDHSDEFAVEPSFGLHSTAVESGVKQPPPKIHRLNRTPIALRKKGKHADLTCAISKMADVSAWKLDLFTSSTSPSPCSVTAAQPVEFAIANCVQVLEGITGLSKEMYVVALEKVRGDSASRELLITVLAEKKLWMIESWM